MTEKTYIAGKDAPLDQTLERARSVLKNIGIELEEAGNLNPVQFCWSVHLRDTKRPELCTNGKGTSKLASLTSGICEFVERLATDFFFSDYYLGSSNVQKRDRSFCLFPDEKWFPQENNLHLYSQKGRKEPQLLNDELLSLYDPDGELTPGHLIDNNLDMEGKGICALPFTRLSDSSLCYFPVALLNNLYLSNGMAAGNSVSEARAQALSEILERYVKNIVISEGLSLPVVPAPELKGYPHLLSIVTELEKSGYSVSIHDSSLGGRYPVVCVLLVDPTTGGAFAAFGANCNFEIAIERTLTELLQGRDLDQLHNFSLPVHSLDLVADPYNLESHFIDSDGLLGWSMFDENPDYPYTGWSFSGTTAEEEAKLIQKISIDGFSIYLREYHHCGLYVCRFIVPGMSEVYPIEDLVWSNRNRGSQLRSRLLQLRQMDNKRLRSLVDLLDELELEDQQLLSHAIGVLFDPESYWNTLRLGELKALIYLALKDRENSLLWCNWVVEFGRLESMRHKCFQAIVTLLELSKSGITSDSYDKALTRFFSETERKLAREVIAGSQSFFGLDFEENWCQISKRHARLIELYDKLAAVKEECAV